MQTATASQVMVLMFTDIVGSVDLKTRLGTAAYIDLISRHDAIFSNIIAQTEGASIIKDTGDGFLAGFANITDAVAAALRFQFELHEEPWESAPVQVRVGVHLGEVTQLPGEDDGPGKLIGLTADLASRVMSLAAPGQILMTRDAFDEVRQYLREHPTARQQQPGPPIRWMAHGRYIFKGADTPMEIFEVGAEGIGPLHAPEDGEKARRVLAYDEEETLGWRPAVGMPIPSSQDWILDKKLGEGGFGEVWMGVHRESREQRVFKFCFDVDRLRSLKRELALFRVISDSLGDRDDIARLYAVHLNKPPFYLESEYTPQGNLVEWAHSKGGLAQVPLQTRLDLVARTARAVAAAHSANVIHKDIKPSNILIHISEDGTPRPRLSDFGIGMLTDRGRLQQLNITATGLTESFVTSSDSRGTGTRMYMPPELLVGKPFTEQGDVYALGVLLYQVVVGDLHRPLASGWQRDVEDPFLREDIDACVDGDLTRRLAAASELARRLETLGQRQEQLKQHQEAKRKSQIRRRVIRWSIVAVVVAVEVLTLGALASKIRQDRAQQRAERTVQVDDSNNIVLPPRKALLEERERRRAARAKKLEQKR